jgi:DnaJ homolog subfamily C member 11
LPPVFSSFRCMGKFPLSSTQINCLTSLHHKASLDLPRPYNTKFGINYEDVNNSIQFKAGLLPFASTNILAETSIVFSRRLWRRQPQRGQLTLQFGRQPSASFMFISSSPPNVTSEESKTPPHLVPPTISGLKQIVFDRRFGVMFENYLPTIFAEATLMLVQLSTQLKCAFNYDFVSGFSYTLGGQWVSETSEVTTALVMSMSGILLQFESAVPRYFLCALLIHHVCSSLSYLEQRITLPIVLSTEYSPILALATIVIPSTAAVLGYHFVVVPRRRNRRLT